MTRNWSTSAFVGATDVGADAAVGTDVGAAAAGATDVGAAALMPSPKTLAFSPWTLSSIS